MYLLKPNDSNSSSYTANGQPGYGKFGFQVMQVEQQQNGNHCSDNPTPEHVRRQLTPAEESSKTASLCSASRHLQM